MPGHRFIAPVARRSSVVDRVTASGLHQVHDTDDNPQRKVEELAKGWVSNFGGTPRDVTVLGTERRFDGTSRLWVIN